MIYCYRNNVEYLLSIPFVSIREICQLSSNNSLYNFPEHGGEANWPVPWCPQTMKSSFTESFNSGKVVLRLASLKPKMTGHLDPLTYSGVTFKIMYFLTVKISFNIAYLPLLEETMRFWCIWDVHCCKSWAEGFTHYRGLGLVLGNEGPIFPIVSLTHPFPLADWNNSLGILSTYLAILFS